jgi:phage-related protein
MFDKCTEFDTLQGKKRVQEIVWNKTCLKKIRNFPEEIRKEIGYLLFKLQRGEVIQMPHSRPMPSIGNGCHELRVKG